MKRIQYHRYGGPEELRLEEFSLPALKPDQIRVRIKAAAANPMDRKIRSGEMRLLTGTNFPRGLGHDFTGIVESVGSQVTKFKVGDEVFGATGLKESGTFAEALVAEEKTAFRKPRGLSFEEAAALPIVSATAWTALIDKAKLKGEQRIFITGCLGGVGRAATQIARMRNAKIVGSCSASRVDEASALGVEEVVDYRNFDSQRYQNCFDVVFDTHGTLTINQCNAMLKRSGMALHIVPTPSKIIWSILSPRHQTIFAQLTQQSMDGIIEAVERGILSPTIGRIVPLSEAIASIIELETNSQSVGKLIISPME